MWTLVNNGTEQSLASWGLRAEVESDLVSKGRDTVNGERQARGLAALRNRNYSRLFGHLTGRA